MIDLNDMRYKLCISQISKRVNPFKQKCILSTYCVNKRIAENNHILKGGAF